MPEDAKLYESWFPLADLDGDGRVTGPDAVKFFERSKLPREKLARVWVLSDVNRQGFLARDDFVRALRAIACLQAGEDISSDKLSGFEDSGYGRIAELEGVEGEGGGEEINAELFAPDPDAELNAKELKKKGKGKEKKTLSQEEVTSIIDGLKRIYSEKIRPLEEQFKFGSFFSPLMTDGDFEGKPMVLLLGQYSTGKTTFIRSLLDRDYPGCHIGPEPTTDRFVIIHHNHDERRVPGNTLVVQPDKPFTQLSVFGSSFLAKLEGSQCDAKLLNHVTFVDTPGVLSGEKQRIDRTYDFTKVCEWFAQRSDLILLLFDPHKLDISDEFRSVIASLKGNDDKVRVVLNKADQVDAQQLMRVYGALMWSLGKVFNTPEVCKVYVGTFSGKPPSTEKNALGKELFEKEMGDLLRDLYTIPSRACDRKVNEFVKRVRAFKTHLLIIGHLRKQMPSMMGKKEKQRKLLEKLEDEFKKVVVEHGLPMGDLPNVNRYRAVLEQFELTKFPKVDKIKMVKVLEDVLAVDLPRMMAKFDNPF
mmetsp:Transcript_12780/g.44395  ORF Transcript_12780/g.44395 Transcript_12780/m.44395 type:complete len:532 (-) Transcript_12780:544-2139(-)